MLYNNSRFDIKGIFMSILEKLTNQMSATIESSVSLALHNKNQEVMPIHLIWALLTNKRIHITTSIK